MYLQVSAVFLMLFACFGFLSPANRGALMQAKNGFLICMKMNKYVCMYVCICVCVCVCVCMYACILWYIYIHIYIYMYTYARTQTHNRRCCSSLSLWAWLADTRQPASSGSLKAPGQFQLGCWLHRNGYMCMNACLGSVRIPSQFDRKDNALFTAMCVCVVCVWICLHICIHRWKENALCTALVFPGVIFCVFFVLNLVVWSQRSSGAVRSLLLVCGHLTVHLYAVYYSFVPCTQLEYLSVFQWCSYVHMYMYIYIHI